eukprot:TRINITY_DN9192_c0_g1_i1.p1 TRINITY_DN9192_c0_g1~~TRINITY_DN9192_c0_g1_i1.p1  ORF type:complete len:310 (-),score=70.97 TRINITY_DN9192_c0_g1_i1:93-1022(-)
MDCSIVETSIPDVFLISTTDFFYPLVEDPYMQGKIGCANVLSDLYSMGISKCDTMLMILAASRDMEERERDICTREMIRGFNDLATEAGTKVTGGQTVLNPWPIIGGVASSVLKEESFIRPEFAVAGDVVILTKALGTQIAVNAHQWLDRSRYGSNKYWERIKDVVTEQQVLEAYGKAEQSMSRLNKNGAALMMKYDAHAATDVTGFGILGHARNLAKAQRAEVSINLHTLPIIAGMRAIDDALSMFKLMEGFSAETSGGLMVCLSAENAKKFIAEIRELDGCDAWEIGNVVEGDHAASISPDVTVLEV